MATYLPFCSSFYAVRFIPSHHPHVTISINVACALHSYKTSKSKLLYTFCVLTWVLLAFVCCFKVIFGNWTFPGVKYVWQCQKWKVNKHNFSLHLFLHWIFGKLFTKENSFYLRNPDFYPLTVGLLMIRVKVFYANVTKWKVKVE